MSADPRTQPARHAVELTIGANLAGWPDFPDKYFGGAARAVIDAADAADKAAGIYRVSLDAAIEAAAKAAYTEANPDYAHGWGVEPEPQRQIYRERVRELVTAAVMGGAQ